ncbi:sporulation-induced protein [Collariella sp. IMI 366227]|nr:sporulation-induced protein [Collariella sp. IMI 366227]
MFWRFGGYANVSTIDTILERDNFELEELLDESDLIQELKQHNQKLVRYLGQPPILKRLLNYVIAPKLEPVTRPEDDEDEDDEEKGKGHCTALHQLAELFDGRRDESRGQYAFVSAEILASDTWEMYDAIMECKPLIVNFWQFLKHTAPLDPLQASYFTKVNEALFDKKTDEMLALLKTMDGAVSDILKHVDSPMIMDLLLKIITLERTEHGQGVVEWLYTQDVMPTLISFLGPDNSWATQTSAADFIKAIITVSANASQSEQTCIGPNELTRQLVSKPCVEQLIKYMLGGGNPLTCGVGIIIEVIRKNNSDYDPEGVEIGSPPSSRDPIYLGTLLRLFAQNVPNFMGLVNNAPAQEQHLPSTFGGKIQPLGFDRFKTCELMAELLHCSNMMLLNEAGAEELISARDVRRQQLRTEGHLLRVGSSEQAIGDLSLNSPQVEESRRLEVMNFSLSADDDGFEEVSHGTEEEHSHGVLELPDAPTHQPDSSLIAKDDDEFVDEPLSPPEPSVQEVENKATERQDYGLTPAPLSPNKKKAQLAVSGEPSSAGQISEPEKTEPSVAATAAPNLEKSKTTSIPTDPAEQKPSAGGEMSPRPEDTPAPLFSEKSTQTASTATAEENAEQSSTQGQGAEAPAQSATETQETATPSSDDASSKPAPVVGDYLKMQFVEHRVVPTILGFFFKYPWNNFLHNVVYDIVQQVFNGPMDRGFNPTLAISLFEAADITNQIIRGQQASEQAERETKTRKGYMGHLTLIAEEVVKFTERHPPELVSELVLEKVMAQDWVNYVEGPLAETRERDNAILGGVRPDVAMHNRANAQNLMSGFTGLSSIGLGGGGSSALADAGLNGAAAMVEGSATAGIGPFAISAGTLMSGFGSSSDEDDDEEPETEEDVNNEVGEPYDYADPWFPRYAYAFASAKLAPVPRKPKKTAKIKRESEASVFWLWNTLDPRIETWQAGGRSRSSSPNAGGDWWAKSKPRVKVKPKDKTRAVQSGTGIVEPGFDRPSLAARLAMNKRNAEAAAAANGQEGSSPPTGEDAAGSSMFSLPNTGSGERLRNPFADYEDDDDEDDQSGSGSDEDGGVESIEGGGSSSAWNRGGWWRGVVRSARRSGSGRNDDFAGEDMEVERFGDGRDDESSDDEDGHRMRVDDDDDEIEDEEFGDFAMPEVENRVTSTGRSTSGSGIDPARESILVKPLAVHPIPATKSAISPFTSLWPFSSAGHSSSTTAKGQHDDVTPTGSSSTTPTAAEPTARLGFEEGITEEPVELTQEEAVLGEDGKKIDRAVEATRRTSIEDPDEDEEGRRLWCIISGAAAEGVGRGRRGDKGLL